MDEVPLPPDGASPEQLLDRHVLRDWIWEAVEELSPVLRLPVVLRYFSSGVTSYQQIAEACAVFVGTVRSRLHQARGLLAQALADTSASGHDDATRRTEASWQEAPETLAAAERGEFDKVVKDRYSPDLSLLSGGHRLGGVGLMLVGMDSDLSAGVRQRPRHVVAGRSLVVWEMDLVNPPDAPGHCPPGVAWIMRLEGGRVDELRLYHATRPAAMREVPTA